jgi:hypothetical protein
MNKYFLSSVAVLFSILFFSCENDEIDDSKLGTEINIKLVFQHKNGTQNFALGTSYTNAFGEAYTVNKFNYYISNVSMGKVNTNLNDVEAESYHLIKAEDATSTSFSFKQYNNVYDAITFYIGVDSLRNVSGAQTGALDPLNGMFWTWNTGYIMAKLEGNSPVSTSPANAITHHIGGFKTVDNTLRKLTFVFPNGAINTSTGGTCEINFAVDVNKWFSGVHSMKIADVSLNMGTGTNAMKYADNYASMFSLVSVMNK